MKSLGLAALKPDFTAPGTKLEVREGERTLTARVVATPFYDPLRLRTHPRG
jgi:aminomethyltransferase